MAEQEEIFKTIVQIIDDYLPGVIDEKLTMDTVINNEAGVDSLGFVLIISKLEAKYDIKISERKMSKFLTIGDVVRYISDKTQKI
jgi:acyl carrier protein